MATHFLIKGTAECDSYYQSLIVYADNEEDARGAAERYLEDDSCRLLAIDPSGTREVASHPSSWREQSTPFGVVAGGGRVFIGRRFASKNLREITSMEYAGVSARAVLVALEALCRESELILVAMGARVPGAARLRCGLSIVHLIDPDQVCSLPAVETLLTEHRQRYGLFMRVFADSNGPARRGLMQEAAC